MSRKEKRPESPIDKIKSLSGPLASEKIFFVHIPKNAGTTVLRNLLRCPHGAVTHATADQINSVDGYDDWRNFVFCRDPIDRFVSVYLWRLRKDELVQSLDIEDVIEMLSDNVREPIDWDFEKDPNKLDRMFNKQTTWTNKNTFYVGKTEKAFKHMKELSDMFGLGFPSDTEWEYKARHNTAKTFGPQPEETKATLLDILTDSPTLKRCFFDYYAEDYETFGYNIP